MSLSEIPNFFIWPMAWKIPALGGSKKARNPKKDQVGICIVCQPNLSPDHTRSATELPLP
jgi:hypothetical protein